MSNRSITVQLTRLQAEALLEWCNYLDHYSTPPINPQTALLVKRAATRLAAASRGADDAE